MKNAPRILGPPDPSYSILSDTRKLSPTSQLLILIFHLKSDVGAQCGGEGEISDLEIGSAIFDPRLESVSSDFIVGSESAKNDLISKPRLQCLYEQSL